MTDGHADRLARAAEKTSARIDAAYAKLAAKLRRRAEKAEAAMGATASDGSGKRGAEREAKHEARRAVRRRRFELYADAAQDIERRLAERRGRDGGSSD